MPFIGTQPDVGGYSVLDALTASATASYTLQKDSANFSPSSANQLLVSLNGVIQKPGSSFTVSGSTLTFSSALTSSDSIDIILAMGEPLLLGTPSDGTVNTSQLANLAVTYAKMASTLDLSGKTVTYGLTDSDMPAGSVLQVVHDSANEQSLAQNTTTTIYNTQITPSAVGNKIFFMVTIPNITISLTDRRITCDGYIGTSATPSSNTKFLTGNAIGSNGSGADNTVTSTMISGEHTTTSTSVHYASLTIATPSNASCSFARHSAISRMVVWEVSS